MATADLLSPEWLLLRTCQDLVQRSKSSDLYDKVRMAGLLEQLLLGKAALVARVNRDPALPIEFWYREPEVTDAERWTSPVGFDASQRRTALGEVRKTGLEPFLAARVVRADEWVTVEQLVRCVSHFYGSPHAPPPDGISHATMRAVDELARSGHGSVIAVALHEIAGVTLRALIPLAESKAGAGERAPGAEPVRRPPAPMAPAGSGCPFAGKMRGD